MLFKFIRFVIDVVEVVGVEVEWLVLGVLLVLLLL